MVSGGEDDATSIPGTKQKLVHTNSNKSKKANIPQRIQNSRKCYPEKPPLTSTKSDLSKRKERKMSTFSNDSEHLRHLSSSDGLLVVRKRSAWSRMTNADMMEEEEEDEEEEPCTDHHGDDGHVCTEKKRKYGIVPSLPTFKSDIMNFFKNSNTRRKQNKDGGRNQSDAAAKFSQRKSNLLRNAVRRMDLDRVRKILSSNKDIDVNATNERGITALHEAAIDGNCCLLRLLFEFGADINVCDNEGFNALDYAVCGGDFECASFLIGNGASENHVRNGLIGFSNKGEEEKHWWDE